MQGKATVDVAKLRGRDELPETSSTVNEAESDGLCDGVRLMLMASRSESQNVVGLKMSRRRGRSIKSLLIESRSALGAPW